MLLALLLAAELPLCVLPKPNAHGCVTFQDSAAALLHNCRIPVDVKCFYVPYKTYDEHGHETDGDWAGCPFQDRLRKLRVDVYGGGPDAAKRAEAVCAKLLAKERTVECRVGDLFPAPKLRFKVVVENP